MTITVTSKTDTVGAITPAGIGVETQLIDVTAQAGDYIIEGYVDLSNMASGDTTVITEYGGIDGSNLHIYQQTSYTGVQTWPLIRFHGKLFYKNALYRVTVNQTVGSSPESYYRTFIQQVLSS